MHRVDPFVADILGFAMETKAELVRDEGIGADLPTTLELYREGVSLGVALPAHAKLDLLQTVRMVIGLSDADHVAFLAEAFAYRSEEPPPQVPAYGDLAQWFANGEPNTSECLQVVSVYCDGRVDLGQVPYRYDGRTVVWGEIWGLGPQARGAMVSMLLEGFTMQSNRPTPPFPVEVIAATLQCDFIVPVLSRPKRNAPCPCGSGAKSKHCCWR